MYPKQAVDDAQRTYANRKAEGGRAVFDATERDVDAIVVRPYLVYGPRDYIEWLNYWIDRVDQFDRIVVPGDGQHFFHRVYVRYLARAFRLVAERGTPGTAYNAGDRHLEETDALIEMIAAVLDRDVELVHVLARDLAAGDLSIKDFVCYRDYTHVLSTERLARLGWTSTPFEDAITDTVETHFECGVGPGKHESSRDRERTVLDHVDGRGSN